MRLLAFFLFLFPFYVAIAEDAPLPSPSAAPVIVPSAENSPEAVQQALVTETPYTGSSDPHSISVRQGSGEAIVTFHADGTVTVPHPENLDTNAKKLFAVVGGLLAKSDCYCVDSK